MPQKSIEDSEIVLEHIKKLASHTNSSCSLKRETTEIMTDAKSKNDKKIGIREELHWVVGIKPIVHM